MAWFKSQIAYTVHEQPDPPADRDERAERLKFVREGFSFLAFVLPPVWMIANRLWLVLVGYLLLVGALAGIVSLLEWPDQWRAYATLAVNLIVAFEADALQRWSLYRRNWRMVGSVSGTSFDEVERRFFESWVPQVAMVTPSNMDRPGQFEASDRRPASHTGEVMPPKRTGWRSQSGWPGFQRS